MNRFYERALPAMALLLLALFALVAGTRLVEEWTGPDYVVYVCYPDTDGSDHDCSQE